MSGSSRDEKSPSVKPNGSRKTVYQELCKLARKLGLQGTLPKNRDTAPPGSTGDKIQVGDVSDEAVVAIGRGARALRIGKISVDLRLLPVVLLLSVAAIVMGYFLWRPDKPGVMTGAFNVAVAEFETLDDSGTPVRSQSGTNLANYVHGQLESSFSELGLEKIDTDLWPPGYTGRVKGRTLEQKLVAVEELAERIQADVVIYGVITQTNQGPRFAPEFYVNYDRFEEAEEVTGQHAMGHPLVVPLPFRRTLASGCPELCARAEALCAITVGLAYYAIDEHQKAIDFFTKAADTPGWFDEDGKEVVYVLLGNASAHLARTEKNLGRLDEAEAYYETALNIRPEYVRAAVGQAGVLSMMAIGLPGEPGGGVDLDKLDRSAAAYEAVLAMPDRPASAILEAKTRFGLGQVYLVRGQIEGDGWTAKAQAEFDWVVQEYEGGNTKISDLAGHAHARLGAIARLRGDIDSAAEQYDKAIEQVSCFYKAEYYADKGEMYADAGKIEPAIDAYEQAVAIAKSCGNVERVQEYDKRLDELK